MEKLDNPKEASDCVTGIGGFKATRGHRVDRVKGYDIWVKAYLGDYIGDFTDSLGFILLILEVGSLKGYGEGEDFLIEGEDILKVSHTLKGFVRVTFHLEVEDFSGFGDVEFAKHFGFCDCGLETGLEG